MLGLRVSPATISRYHPELRADSGAQQRWKTFLRNHRDLICAMDSFVVPTARFRLLYAWVLLDHGRRRVLHINLTAHPSAHWVVQQLREAFPEVPHHRHRILDNDAKFAAEVMHSIAGCGIDPKRTAFRSPWKNGAAERFVGTVRRELLDHVVVLDERQLRRLLQESVEYDNAERVHSSIDDTPEGRACETRSEGPAAVTALPRVGGLHHRSTWRRAA
jgi:transposase InsO family protein